MGTPRRLLSAIELAVPAEACWRAFLRLEDWPRWFPTLRRVERRGLGPFRVGDEMTLHLDFRGRSTRVAVRVAEIGPDRMRWVGRSFGVTGDHAYRVEPLGEGRCRFVSEEIFSGLPVRLIPGRIFDELEREHAHGMDRFRRLVET